MYIVDLGLVRNFKMYSIEDAKEVADEQALWTGKDINIIDDKTGRIVARRKWHDGTIGEEKEENTIRLLDIGYYGDWEVPKLMDSVSLKRRRKRKCTS